MSQQTFNSFHEILDTTTKKLSIMLMMTPLF